MSELPVYLPQCHKLMLGNYNMTFHVHKRNAQAGLCGLHEDDQAKREKKSEGRTSRMVEYGAWSAAVLVI
jgi:hypothetical protein